MHGSHEERPTYRFSGRVGDYVRYRPRYPRELLAWLGSAIGFTPAWRVADIGSGTGIFSQLLLENGNVVFAVEPNDAMRHAAEVALASYPGFTSVRGTSDATTLGDHSVDLVTAAQAFHWFEPSATRREFARVLKRGASVLIVFNSRVASASPFMRAYEDFLIARAVDYTKVDHRLVDGARLHAFLGDYREWRHRFTKQHDLEGVLGLSASSSYSPAPGHAAHDAFYSSLRALFADHERDGVVEFVYETEAYIGRG